MWNDSYSNTIISTILTETLTPQLPVENILSPQFCIKISSQNFHMVLRKMIENVLIKIVFWIINFLLVWCMHIHNNDMKPATSQNYDIL